MCRENIVKKLTELSDTLKTASEQTSQLAELLEIESVEINVDDAIEEINRRTMKQGIAPLTL